MGLSILWNVLRHEHDRKMKFPYEEKSLRVLTLGGAVQEIDGVIYRCKVLDQKGNVYEFSAHGLDSVMGDLGSPISKEVMKKTIP